MDKIKFIVVPVLLLVWLMGGCASKKLNSLEVSCEKKLGDLSWKDKKLIKRFLNYWHARINGDLRKSWEYELPYQRYLMTYNVYKTLAGGYDKKTKIKLIGLRKVNKNEAILKREVKEDGKVIIKKDKWIYVNNIWYHKFYQSSLPPKSIEEADFQ